LPDADAPEVFGIGELSASRRTRAGCKGDERGRDHLSHMIRQLGQLPLGGGRQDDPGGSHSRRLSPSAIGWRPSRRLCTGASSFSATGATGGLGLREEIVQAVLSQDCVEGGCAAFLRFSERRARVLQIGGIFGRFQPAEVIRGYDRRDGLTVAFDNHAFPAVFGAAEDIRKPILCLGNCHRGHRPLWPF